MNAFISWYAEAVLILVVVEDSIWPVESAPLFEDGNVLILVVVEDSIWHMEVAAGETPKGLS